MGLFSKIFGGSKDVSSSKETTYNKAYEPINTAFSPLLGYVQQGAKSVSDFLSGDMTGFNTYKDSTGFDFLLNRGFDGINSGMAARRMLQSGATLKGLQEYGTGLNQTFADRYLEKQLALAGLGTGAAQAMTGAGTFSEGTSSGVAKSYDGIGKFLGTIASGIAASDHRLKMNIEKIGELPNGLGKYRYDYIDGRGPFIGVMADEVERIQPEALGPEIDGFKTVNYALIEGL